MGAVGRAEDSAFAVTWLVAEKREALSLALLDRLAILHKKEKLFWSCVFLETWFIWKFLILQCVNTDLERTGTEDDNF